MGLEPRGCRPACKPEACQPLVGGGARHERHHRNQAAKRSASRRDARPDAMTSTYLSLHYQLVFGTKNREAIIVPAWRARLHDYLGGTFRGLGGFPEGIGGGADPVPPN